MHTALFKTCLEVANYLVKVTTWNRYSSRKGQTAQHIIILVCRLNTRKLFAGTVDIRKEFGEDNFPYAWEVLPIALRNSDRETS